MTNSWEHDHIVHIGNVTETPVDPASDANVWRKRIEPWLSAVFQAEHLSLLLGNGFATAMAIEAGAEAASMETVSFACPDEDKVTAHAKKVAALTGRGTPNIEDQLSSALSLLNGLRILEHNDTHVWEAAINSVLGELIRNVLGSERGVAEALEQKPTISGHSSKERLVSFLMSFASRTATRDRLNIFTTNYDRIIEKGCDLAGLRLIDRFVGALEPEYRSSRLQVDMHYMPPGVRGEPRHLEGIVRLTKLHGSLDWRHISGRLFKTSLPFGANEGHPSVLGFPEQSVIIYPNAAKDVETAVYPYADLFRDFSASVCQPNSVVVTYGYGFGDDHVNRVLADMLTIPSSHLVIIAWSEKPHERIGSFLSRLGRPQQVTLMVGTHFGDLRQLVEHYLPKPAIDPLTIRMAELVERRGNIFDRTSEGGA